MNPLHEPFVAKAGLGPLHVCEAGLLVFLNFYPVTRLNKSVHRPLSVEYGMPTQLILLTLQTKGLKFVVCLILKRELLTTNSTR